MKSMIVAASLSLALAGATVAQTTGQPAQPAQPGQAAKQLSQAQCQQVWTRMNPSSSPSVTQQQAQSYLTNFSEADQNKDGQLSQAEFDQACQRGLVQETAATGAGTGGASGTGAGQSGTGATGSGQPKR